MSENIGLYHDNEYWIETHTGKRVTPLHLTTENVDIRDIAHALSLVCRFNGHCIHHYSVAQHSIHVCNLLLDYSYNDDAEEMRLTRLIGLLHDAGEAYMTDVTRPVKQAIKDIKEIEQRILGVIVQKFVPAGGQWDYVHQADVMMLKTEAYHLMPSRGRGWFFPHNMPMADPPPLMWPTEVEELFLERFHELYRTK